MEYVLLFVVGIVAAYLQCAIGFGSAVLMINVLPFFLRVSLTVVVTQFSCIVFPVYMVFKLYRKVRMDVLLPVLIPSLVCTVIATRISIGMDTGTMKLLLGILFVLLSVYFFFVADRMSLRPTRLTGAVVGSVSGILGGLFVAGGPPVVLYMAPALEDKDEYVATIQVYFLALNAMSLLTRVISKAVSPGDLPYMTAAALGALLGAVIGMKYTTKIKGVLLRRFIYAFVGVNGIVMILNELF